MVCFLVLWLLTLKANLQDKGFRVFSVPWETKYFIYLVGCICFSPWIFMTDEIPFCSDAGRVVFPIF